MKFAAFLPLVLALSASAGVEPWQDLRVDDAVWLSQNLVLEGKSGGTIRILKGQKYVVESIEPLEGLSLVDLTFRAIGCRHPEVESALTLVLPARNPPGSKSQVGVYRLRDCALEVLVEARDYAAFSFFQR